MNRFLSRRDKDGIGHRRDKSRDKSGDKSENKKPRGSSSVLSLSAACSNPQRKAAPLIQTFYSNIHGTKANYRPVLLLQTRPRSGDGILSMFKTDKTESQDPPKSPDTEQSRKIQFLKEQLNGRGYTDVDEQQITYALSSLHATGDVEKALELLVLFQESVEGVIKPYKSEIHMLGAENREMVTCYLDSLLFAMFGRLASFEPILCTSFDDEPRRRLSTLIRLWVNMLRDGKLIRTDLTRHLQEALAACGWQDAARIEQQDVSEAFCFITEILQLPLLTLKVDIYHTGGADNDDHRFVEERLLNVAVPDEAPSERPIRLEDCLENYFNNRIEVKRHLERTNTMTSVRSGHMNEKESPSQHVEVAIKDLPWASCDTPTSINTPSTPVLHTPTPNSPRGRAISIVRRVDEEDSRHGATPELETTTTRSSLRRTATGHRKEILMPAWQFFNLIRPLPIYLNLIDHSVSPPHPDLILIGGKAWYTKSTHSNGNNAGISAHLSQTSPVLGICLKRYGMTEDGKFYRKNTFIDIPLDIRLPHFIDDGVSQEGHQMGNFKLSLQSVICHRGNSVNAGHYISFIRGTTPIADGDSQSTRRLSNASHPPHYPEERWLRFDDLGEERVSYVDIEQAMKSEMPYLLFYQVQPTNANGISTLQDQENEPPSYNESTVSMQLTESTPKLNSETGVKTTESYFDGAAQEVPTPTIRLSTEIERPPTPRRSINLPEERRGSLAFTEASLNSAGSSVRVISAPVTPNEETTAQRMSRAASRFSGKSSTKSRPPSQSGESRISSTFSRLILIGSKDNLNKGYTPPKEPPGSHDGPAEPRKSITIEEPILKPSELKSPEFGIDRSKSKREKKRERSKDRNDKADKSDGEHYHSHHRSKGKGRSKEDNDRECVIM